VETVFVAKAQITCSERSWTGPWKLGGGCIAYGGGEEGAGALQVVEKEEGAEGE